MLLVASESQ